jgi:hypothetical protein
VKKTCEAHATIIKPYSSKKYASICLLKGLMGLALSTLRRTYKNKVGAEVTLKPCLVMSLFIIDKSTWSSLIGP